MTILITGLIGSGKSAAARRFEARGIPVYDSDSRCKALYDEVPGLKSKLEDMLGLKFSEFARIFDCTQKKKALEDTVYPLLKEDFLRWRASKGGIAAIESALAGSDPRFADIYDKVLLVRAPESLRLERNPAAAGRSVFQREPSRWDWVVENDGTLIELNNRIDKIIDENRLK